MALNIILNDYYLKLDLNPSSKDINFVKMLKKIKKEIKKNRMLFSILNSVVNYRALKWERHYDRFFTNIIEGTLVVKLNNISGEFEIDVRSDILKRIVLTKEYEPRIVNLILENINSNEDAINIGANIGLFSNLLADNINSDNKVLAIEPTTRALEILKNNISRNNNQDKIIVFEGLANDIEGVYEINIVPGKFVHSSVKKENIIKEKVNGVTLDSLVIIHKINAGIMVIDVEGAEMNVLKGAVETIKKCTPVIISELDDDLLKEQGSNSKEVVKFLQELKYTIIDPEGGKLEYPFTGNIIAIPLKNY